jgi:hypothetical protein
MKLTMTTKQVYVLMECLEFYERWLMGQLDYLPPTVEDMFPDIWEFKERINQIKVDMLKLSPNASHGIFNQAQTHNNARVAYEMNKAIAKHLAAPRIAAAAAEGKYYFGVDGDGVMLFDGKTSSGEPVVIIED